MKKGKRILAIASGGGHWVQLRRLSPALDKRDIAFASVDPSSASDVPDHRYYSFKDASRQNPLSFFILFFQLVRILLTERPGIVITTGSAPALLALFLAKTLLHSKTIWIDSIANHDEMSSSGKRAHYAADIWLSQWEHLRRPEGPDFWGAVL